MTTDPYIAFISLAADNLDAAAEDARQRGAPNSERFAERQAKELREWLAAIHSGPPQRPLTAKERAYGFGPLPDDWPEKLRERLLATPLRMLWASEASKWFHRAGTAQLVSAAASHPWFDVVAHRQGHTITLREGASTKATERGNVQ